MPPRATIRRGRNITILDFDNTPRLLAVLPFLKVAAVEMGAAALKREMEKIFATQGGDDPWGPNSDLTIRWKGHNRIMQGRTGSLSDRIDIRIGSAEIPPVERPHEQRLIGWFDEPHPDSATGLTVGEVAMAHEFGVLSGENLPRHSGQGSDPIFGMTGRRGTAMDIPPRPWASAAADGQGDEILAKMESGILFGVRGVLLS
jgi:hypothetical protein